MEHGDKVEVIGIARDISERKRLGEERARAEALQESERRLERLLEGMDDGYCVIQGYQIAFVNSRGAEMFGYSRGEVMGKTVETLLPPEVEKELRTVYSTPQPNAAMPSNYQATLPKKDGTPIPVELGARLTEYGGRSAVSVVIRDITERKVAEAKLKQTMAELERSNKELQQFAYVASHDLQEPLRMVASYTQLLAERYKGKLDDKADLFINYAVDGSMRMQSLINDLLSYSRVTTRAHPLKSTDFNLVLVRSLMNLGVTIKQNDAVITSDDLPTVIADESQMGQVLQNLIGNAIKFRREEQPRIHISVKEEPGEWAFSVEDNGIGIEPEYTERIFVLFQRLHNRSKYPGTGIGLTLCKKIVERHGGRIWVESKPGEGSKFYFSIPKREIEHKNKIEELLGVRHE